MPHLFSNILTIWLNTFQLETKKPTEKLNLLEVITSKHTA